MGLKGTGKSVDASLADCVSLLFAGVTDLEARHAFFRALSDTVGSIGSGLERSSLSGQIIAPVRYHENYILEPEIAETYVRFANLNPFKKIFQGSEQEGQVAIGSDHVDLSTLEDSQYWEGFMRPYDIRYPARIVPHLSEDMVTICHFGKTRRAGDFTPGERALLSRIAPHMTNFFRLDQYVDSLVLARETAWGALDALAVGVVLMSADRKVEFRNARAVKMAESRDGLLFMRNTIAAEDQTSNRLLQEALDASFAALMNPSARPPGAASVSVRRTSGKSPYRLAVATLNAAALTRRSGLICLVIRDPDDRVQGEIEQLMKTFGLTRSESEVAIAVALGQSLDECALRTGRKIGTVRNLLKRALLKTDTGRQNALAHRVLTEVLLPITRR
ncbi:MAG: helix-turn-helix transcriptional regulator [Gammaproteobacteria bacterium]|nr:helix-turn-helix transcriptional regulator [Gammaproteobacteria bacterium]